MPAKRTQERILAHLRGQERARYVARMFARISGRYDLLNTVMTAGRHHAWRRIAADMAVGDQRGPALDLAGGTGDFAFDLASKSQVARVVCLDFSPEMLRLASRKGLRRGMAERVGYVLADAHALPFEDDHFIGATVGFGVRNYIDVPRALREMVRVVRPGGRVALLEIVRMEGRWPVGWVFPRLFRYVIPWLGAALAGNREAYTYLPQSVRGGHSAMELGAMMENAGLADLSYRMLALGAVAIVVGRVPG